MQRSFYRLIAPYCLLVLILGSFLPYSMKRDMGTSVVFPSSQHQEQVPLRHRLVHYLSFGITAAVLILAARNRTHRILGVMTVIVLSFAIEYGQSLVGRVGVEWWDVRDDTAAACAVFVVLLSPAVRQLLVKE